MTGTLTTIDPRHTALLVMDYQAGTLGRLTGAESSWSRPVGVWWGSRFLA